MTNIPAKIFQFDLIGRLEAASGPDRQLDGDIFAAVGGEPWEQAKLRASMPSGAPEHVIEREARGYAPRYTESVDAAMTLAPQKWSTRVGNLPSGKWYASLGTQESLQEIVGCNPAVALCLVSLKALAQTGGRGNG